jgi:Fe-S-cluster-containing dehydrogenase component/CRP-like cAMP-binding protein
VTAWPHAVWRSPWLEGLDDVGREQVQAAGRVRSFDEGARVFAPGDPADAIFVVGEGLIDVRAVRRGDAEARRIRRAVAGDALGEEAIVRAGASRGAEATCATRAVVAEVPVALFRRIAGRAGAGKAADLERSLRRAAARDVLRSSALAPDLSDGDIEALLASTEHRVLARGDRLFASGDPATHAYVVADGLVQLQDERDGRLRVRAYLSRGDLVGGEAIERAGVHELTAAASGPAWVLAIARAALVPVARRVPSAIARARRVAEAPPLPEQTRHVLGDLWRFAVAGSMLVVDDEACVRCGHCAWSCADEHGDGVSRLVVRGDKVFVQDATDGASRALIVPGSCQHCKQPACMQVCPTGAIGRDARGDVFVREELCVGCGQCVKACPWDSVQMAPRPGLAGKSLPVAVSRDVAVKCDMCREAPAGPACVRACPVDAIARIEPLASIADVRKAVAAPPPKQALPPRRVAWPWLAGAGVLALGAARVPAGSPALRMGTGAVAGVLVVALAAYAVLKRRRGDVRGPVVSRVRPHLVAHMALGLVAVGVVAAHSRLRVPPNAAGALLLAFVLASVTGVLGALAYRLVPPALSKVERRAMLAEDLAARARDLDDRAFGALTGRSEASKAVYARWLAPYARAALGGVAMLAARTTLRDEQRRLRARVERVLGARVSTLDGLDDLVRLVVERRAVRAQRLLHVLLRAWVPVHVVAVGVAAVLLAAHVVAVLGSR